MDLRSAWEDNAKDWIAWCRRPGLDAYRYHRDQFLRIVPPPGELTLDVGCGEGRLARDLAARGHSVIAFDGSPTMIAAALEDYFAAMRGAGFVTEVLYEPAAPAGEQPHYRRNPRFLHVSARRS